MTNDNHANREYKATLFHVLFQEPREALALYNAVRHTSYDNPDDLTITTLEDVIYIGMKNDLSFLIGHTMNLYEHQSTFNPNMPLRGLFYLSRLYEGYVEQNNLDIYSSTLLKLPLPQYLVFYNGKQEMEECIHEDILVDLLKKNRAKVCNMILTEYDSEFHVANEKKLSYEEGKLLGEAHGKESVFLILIQDFLDHGLSKEDILDKLISRYQLSSEEAEEYYEKVQGK